MDNLLGVLLRGAASAQIALPAFNVHNLEFIDGVVQAGIDLD
jgi:fructose/tagatose bisphosphate aldolase